MKTNPELQPVKNNDPSDCSEFSKAIGQSGILDNVSLYEIKGTIAHLAGFATRFTFSGGSEEAGRWIYERFVAIGYSDVAYQDFILCDSLQKNVICSKQGCGESDKILILCAHYDSTARSTTGWDWQTCPAPGANDNATGVAAMLEIARILRNVEMDHTVRFIAFTGEEQNLWGSRAYADLALSNKMNIVLVINLDEIGYPDSKPPWKIIIGEDQGTHMTPENADSHRFARVMKRAALDYTSLRTAIRDIWTSDHMPFNSAGYAVIGVCQAGRYPHSHEVTDIPANIDTEYVAEATRMTLAAILHAAGIMR